MKDLVYIDTGAFLARYLANDSQHKRSLEIWKKLESSKLIASNHVLDETMTLIGRRAGYSFAADRGEAIMNSKILKVLYTDQEIEENALTFFRKYADQGLSFTDAISFSIVTGMKIKTVFSFDEHFDLLKVKRLK
jgi:predicted nucleic acid-binding protein